jgi:hypothetical protein
LSVTPGQEFIETSNLVVGNAAENVGEPGLRIDAVAFKSSPKISRLRLRRIVGFHSAHPLKDPSISRP